MAEAGEKFPDIRWKISEPLGLSPLMTAAMHGVVGKAMSELDEAAS